MYWYLYTYLYKLCLVLGPAFFPYGFPHGSPSQRQPGRIIPQKDQRGCLSPPAPGLHIQQVAPFTDARSVGIVGVAPGGTTWSSTNTIYIYAYVYVNES